VPIRKSVTDAYVICLEDGKKLKILKRYLRSNYNLTIMPPAFGVRQKDRSWPKRPRQKGKRRT
jgi:predicted transcriptional regulator